MKIQFILAGLLILCFESSLSIAQSFDWNWAKHFGGSGDDEVQCVTTDVHGNVYTTGWFKDSIDIDPGQGVYSLVSGGTNAFIYKSDSSGNFIWAKLLAASTFIRGYSIAIDGSGNIICLGEYSGTVDFDPGAGVFNSTVTVLTSTFILKLDSLGNFIWADTFHSPTGSFNTGVFMDVTANNEIYIVGYLTGTVDFDPGSGIYNLVSIGVARDIFIVKLDSDGDLLWANSFGAPNGDQTGTIHVDNWENVYLTGHFTNTVDFDPGPGIFNMYSSSPDMFVLKLNSFGNFIWAKQMGGFATGSVRGHAITTDDSGNVYTTGAFSTSADFDPGPGNFSITVNGDAAFISKLDSSGNFIWAKAMSGPSIFDIITGHNILLDPVGNIFISGFFNESFDADPGPGVYNLIAIDYHDGFILSLDNTGNFLWATSFGGDNADHCTSMTMDLAGAIYLTGLFLSPTISFGTLSFSTASIGYYDGYIAKLGSSTITGFENSEGIISNSVLYPNPASQKITVKLREFQDNVEISITDITGKKRLTKTLNNTTATDFNTSTLDVGAYFVKIVTPAYTETFKLLIQH